MAIGDTVQAGLGRMDFSAFQTAGAAQARANEAFGNALGDAATAYFEGKKKKEQKNALKEYLMRNGANEEDANAMTKSPQALEMFNQKLARDQQMDIAKMQVAARRAEGGANRAQVAAKMEAEQNLRNQDVADTNAFIDTLYSKSPTGELNKAGEQEVENFKAFAAPEDPRINPFIEQTLQDPQFQETAPVISLTGNTFMEQFETPGSRRLAYNYLQSRQKDAPSISRVVNMEDGQGGFQQVGVDSAGNPIKSFGPPKPSGMFATPDQQADARAKTLSVDNANDFVNDQRNSALDSAKSIRPATRALTLLEKGDLETGGVAELKTNAIAMLDSLGIPIDKETMDRVSNTQNFRAEVGKFLFENISNTKGSISEKEMDIFAKISPGLQMTPEANKTLLNYVIKKAERDKEKVKFIQKMRRDGVSITEQRNKLEDYMLENDLSEILSPIAGETSEQQSFRSPQGNVNGKVVGTKPNGDKLIEVNGKIFVQPAQ